MSIIHFSLCPGKRLRVTPSVSTDLFLVPAGPCGFVSGVESVDKGGVAEVRTPVSIPCWSWVPGRDGVFWAPISTSQLFKSLLTSGNPYLALTYLDDSHLVNKTLKNRNSVFFHIIKLSSFDLKYRSWSSPGWFILELTCVFHLFPSSLVWIWFHLSLYLSSKHCFWDSSTHSPYNSR